MVITAVYEHGDGSLLVQKPVDIENSPVNYDGFPTAEASDQCMLLTHDFKPMSVTVSEHELVNVEMEVASFQFGGDGEERFDGPCGFFQSKEDFAAFAKFSDKFMTEIVEPYRKTLVEQLNEHIKGGALSYPKNITKLRNYTMVGMGKKYGEDGPKFVQGCQLISPGPLADYDYATNTSQLDKYQGEPIQCLLEKDFLMFLQGENQTALYNRWKNQAMKSGLEVAWQKRTFSVNDFKTSGAAYVFLLLLKGFTFYWEKRKTKEQKKAEAQANSEWFEKSKGSVSGICCMAFYAFLFFGYWFLLTLAPGYLLAPAANAKTYEDPEFFEVEYHNEMFVYGGMFVFGTVGGSVFLACAAAVIGGFAKQYDDAKSGGHGGDVESGDHG